MDQMEIDNTRDEDNNELPNPELSDGQILVNDLEKKYFDYIYSILCKNGSSFKRSFLNQYQIRESWSNKNNNHISNK